MKKHLPAISDRKMSLNLHLITKIPTVCLLQTQKESPFPIPEMRNLVARQVS